MQGKTLVTHVLFDLDGLLIDSEKIYTRQLAKFLSKHGKKFTFHAKQLMMGRTPLEAAEALQKEYNLPMDAEEVLEEYRKELPLEIWHSTALMPGAQKLVEYFWRHSIPMAIATGSHSSQVPHKMWNHSDVWQYIHHVVAAGDDPEVNRGKPAPDVFLVALKRFNDPSAGPETTLVFEDAWNGVQAGLTAGMRVVWVPEAEEVAGFSSDTILSDEANPRVIRLTSLEEFDPKLFGLPPS